MRKARFSLICLSLWFGWTKSRYKCGNCFNHSKSNFKANNMFSSHIFETRFRLETKYSIQKRRIRTWKSTKMSTTSKTHTQIHVLNLSSKTSYKWCVEFYLQNLYSIIIIIWAALAYSSRHEIKWMSCLNVFNIKSVSMITFTSFFLLFYLWTDRKLKSQSQKDILCKQTHTNEAETTMQ